MFSISGIQKFFNASTSPAGDIGSPLLSEAQPTSSRSSRINRGAMDGFMVSPSANKNLSDLQYSPEYKLSETLVKLMEDPKFILFSRKVDNAHFNQKLGEFLSQVDEFKAETKIDRIFNKSYTFTLLDIKSGQEFCYKISDKESGLYEYIPEMGSFELIDGKKTFSDGEVQEGKYTYSSGSGSFSGKIISSGGEIKESKFDFALLHSKGSVVKIKS